MGCTPLELLVMFDRIQGIRNTYSSTTSSERDAINRKTCRWIPHVSNYMTCAEGASTQIGREL